MPSNAQKVYRFPNSEVLSHAFNADMSKLAVALGDHRMLILGVPSGTGPNAKFTVLQELSNHVDAITCIDWSPKHDQILTCSADKNIFVYSLDDDKKYAPEMTVVRNSRAVTCVKWSPYGNKFAAGTGSKAIPICEFDEQNHMWTGKKPIHKNIKSTVTCLAWHPNNCLIAAGATDFKVRIANAFLKKSDKDEAGNPLKEAPETKWGPNQTYGSIVCETSLGNGWVTAVQFSPDGNRLAFLRHSSMVYVATGTGGATPATVHINLDSLPMRALAWLGDDCFVAGGYGYYLQKFTVSRDGASLKEGDKLLEEDKGPSDGKVSAKKFFANMDKRGQDASGGSNTVSNTLPKTVHQNYIREVKMSATNKLTTSGGDGIIVVWKL